MEILLPCKGVLNVPSPMATVGELKRHIETVIEVPINTAIIVLDQRILDDDETLNHHASPYHLVLRVGEASVVCGPATQDLFPNHRQFVAQYEPRPSPMLARFHEGQVRFHAVGPHYDGDEERQKLIQATASTRHRVHEANQADRQEALARLISDLPPGPIIVMTFNHGVADLFRNWMRSCETHDIDARQRTIVFPMDEASHHIAQSLGFRSFFDGVSYGNLPTTAAEVIGDQQFRDLMFVKSAVVHDALGFERDLLFQDVDVVWLKDPIPDLVRTAEQGRFDYQFMFDGINPLYQPTYFNSGFFFIRNSERARHAWATVHNNFDKVLSYGGQQVVVNLVMQFYRERGLEIRTLPERSFVNGHLLRSTSDPRPSPFDLRHASVVHASWTRNSSVKRSLLKDNALWFVED